MIRRLVLLFQTGSKLSPLLSFQGSIADTRANTSRNRPIMNIQMWGIKSAPFMALFMKFSTPDVEESLVSLQWSTTNFTSFLWMDLWGVIPLLLTRNSLCSSLGNFASALKDDFLISRSEAQQQCCSQVLLV